MLGCQGCHPQPPLLPWLHFAQNAPAFAQKSFGLDFRVERSLGIRGYTSLLYGQNPQGT